MIVSLGAASSTLPRPHQLSFYPLSRSLARSLARWPDMEMGMAVMVKCPSMLRSRPCYTSPLSVPSPSFASRFSRSRSSKLAATPPTPPGRHFRLSHLRCCRGSKTDAVEREAEGGRGAVEDEEDRGDAAFYCVSPFPLLLVAALPGAETVGLVFGPFVELVKSWNLPDWLVHWGHPANMAVVLFAMGGYGTYLGFRIRFSDDVEEKAMAKDLHPKLLGGMFFFFALGATGGITSLLTSDKPILESPHAVTGAIGLTLLTIQTILPALFEGNPGLRNVHGFLGSSIMALFLVHAALGLQLGLSY